MSKHSFYGKKAPENFELNPESWIPTLTRDKLASLAEEVMKTKKAAHYLDPASGIEFTIRPTGWTDANGVWGYAESSQNLQTTVSRLSARERASKTNDGKPLPTR